MPARDVASPGPGQVPSVCRRTIRHPGRNPLLMVVDCRAGKRFGDLPAREVRLRFDDHVKAIRVLEGAAAPRVAGRQVRIALNAGEGQLLELEGVGLAALCSSLAICGQPPVSPAPTSRHATEADLAAATEARLRLEVFGANAGEQYRARYLELNGQRLGTVPAKPGDSWGAVDVGDARAFPCDLYGTRLSAPPRPASCPSRSGPSRCTW